MFNKYDAYKDSCEGWIGLIPNHWEVFKLKHLFTEKKHKKNMSLNSGSISFGEVVYKDDEKITEATKASYQEVLKGEFLLNPLNLNYDLISLRIALSKINVVVSAGYIVLLANNIVYKEYFKYLLHRYDVAYMKLLGSGVRQTISFNHIANSLLPYPSMLEQKKIAEFLDQKTSEIAQAIAIKEQQIALLHERKQIVIQKAVTQGLDPNVVMKDSGVEWIGQIPEHWEISRIKHLGKILNGFAFPSDSFTDQGVRVLKISNIQTMTLDWQDESYIDEKWKKIATNALVYKGDLVFALTRPIISTGLKATIIDSDETMLLNQRNAVLRPNNKVIKEWLYYVLLADGFVQEFEKKIDITGQQPNISTVSIGNLPLVYPTLDEQVQICETLERICQIIDEAINVEKKSIHQLKEYKTTLINDAVTGKIKVA